MSNNEDIVTQLRSFSQAYPEDLFRPPTKEEVAVVHKAYPGYTDRNSAAMGRHCAKFMAEAADRIEQLDAEIAAWRARFPEYNYRPQDDCVAFKLLDC